MHKIRFIIPYFGKLRSDFCFWLKSAEHNASIDFLIFTDQEICTANKNITVIKCELPFIEKIAKQKIWECCRINHPYKLCDYKTAYGELFQDYLQGYDFWGHCDVDLVFGNIRNYITDDILDNHDRIGVEGFFTLYRNNTEINHHYWNLGEDFIKKAFLDDAIYGLDEWGPGGNGGGTSNWWITHRKERLWMDMIFDSIEPYTYEFITKRALNDETTNVIFRYNNGTLMRYGLKNGKVTATETLLAHVQKRTITTETSETDKFCIIPPGRYVDYKEVITSNYLRTFTYKALLYKIKNKIRRIFNHITR